MCAAFDCANTQLLSRLHFIAFSLSSCPLCFYGAQSSVRDELLTEGSGVLYKDGMLRVYMWFNFGTHRNAHYDMALNSMLYKNAFNC